ncbi:MAG: hypothetical protein HOO96_34940 [Polyangiaceae bacterium]|nr:hypothetical protein [Polyangiaceae bacterium]
MVALLIIGSILLLIGIIVTLVNLKNVRRRKRILGTPTSPIAQAPGQGPVEVKGRIVPSEQGLLQTPFSGRQAVWCRIIVQEYRQHGRSGSYVTILNEVDCRHFMVDDGSGQQARILPQGAHMILEAQQVASSGTFNDASPHLQGFLQSRGLSTTSWLGFNKSMRYSEEILSPGDNLYALGPSRRDAGPPVSDGYRMVPGSQLVLFAGAGEVNELILTNKTEEQVVSKLLYGFIGGLVMTGLGAAAGFVGLVMGILDSM